MICLQLKYSFTNQYQFSTSDLYCLGGLQREERERKNVVNHGLSVLLLKGRALLYLDQWLCCYRAFQK